MASFQKKTAAKILKVGVNRVWIDPSKIEEVKKAVTKADLRKLISKGYIKKLPEKKKKKREKKRRKGPGSRKGKRYSTLSKKRRWVLMIRSLRRYIRDLRDEGKITKETYKRLIKLAKGGMFRSRAHIKIYLEQRGLIKKSDKK